MSQDRFSLPDTETKPAFVRHGFDSIAGKYDLLNDLMTGGLHRRWKRETIRRLCLSPGMRVLDFCSGTGDLAMRAVPDILPGGHVTALDFSQRMMVAGRRRKWVAEGLDSLAWLCGDAMRLPFPEACFDAACVGFGLRNVVSIDTVLHEVFRVLRPGAWLVNLDTAESEWRIARPFYKLYMSAAVPLLGKLFAGSRDMYAYLSSSAEAFETPRELQKLLQTTGFQETGFAFRPRILGGAALVWGQKPERI